jgi:hypothetical protein
VDKCECTVVGRSWIASPGPEQEKVALDGSMPSSRIEDLHASYQSTMGDVRHAN